MSTETSSECLEDRQRNDEKNPCPYINLSVPVVLPLAEEQARMRLRNINRQIPIMGFLEEWSVEFLWSRNSFPTEWLETIALNPDFRGRKPLNRYVGQRMCGGVHKNVAKSQRKGSDRQKFVCMHVNVVKSQRERADSHNKLWGANKYLCVGEVSARLMCQGLASVGTHPRRCATRPSPAQALKHDFGCMHTKSFICPKLRVVQKEKLSPILDNGDTTSSFLKKHCKNKSGMI